LINTSVHLGDDVIFFLCGSCEGNKNDQKYKQILLAKEEIKSIELKFQLIDRNLGGAVV
jgi:hypothetical protein